jgi:hypothetical protein
MPKDQAKTDKPAPAPARKLTVRTLDKIETTGLTAAGN